VCVCVRVYDVPIDRKMPCVPVFVSRTCMRMSMCVCPMSAVSHYCRRTLVYEGGAMRRACACKYWQYFVESISVYVYVCVFHEFIAVRRHCLC